MLANALFIVVSGVLMLAVSAVPALFGGNLSTTLLVISFGWGIFMGLLVLRHHGSAAGALRYWRSPPR